MKNLRAHVFESLDNAEYNAPEILNMGAEGICNDLIMYDADLTDYKVEELLPHVNAWLEKRSV